MPELPEVETTLNGIRPYLEGRTIHRLRVRERRLRWPIAAGLEARLRDQPVTGLFRRGKYIVIRLPTGSLIVHLGMSGSLRVLLRAQAAAKHDHFDLIMQTGTIIRYHDPRRFGCLLWTAGNPLQHVRLAGLGVEPLSDEFNGERLFRASRRSRVAVKSLLMNGRVVVGVGNIYASESLFDAGIHPLRASNRIALPRYVRLAQSVKTILQAAIAQGGTTLRDFVQADGTAGYFRQVLNVYERDRQPCRHCTAPIRRRVVAQRSTFYCGQCQR